MKFLILFIIFFSLFCNRGPAEDRGRKDCNERKQNTLLLYLIATDPNLQENDSRKKNANFFWPLNSFLIDSDCDRTNREDYIQRYYRGYVNGKK